MHIFESIKKLLETESIKKETKNQEINPQNQNFKKYYSLFAKGVNEILVIDNGKNKTIPLNMPLQNNINEKTINKILNDIIKKKFIYLNDKNEIFLDKNGEQPLNEIVIDKLKTQSNENIPNNQTNSDTCYVLFSKDGDTFVGMHNQTKKTFRLAGIDTPEIGRPFSQEAKKFLSENINKKVIYIKSYGLDIYNREIVDIYLDKNKTQHINKMLIEKGFATSERYTNKNGETTNSLISHVSNEIAEKKAFILSSGMWGGMIADDLDNTNQQENNEHKKNKPN